MKNDNPNNTVRNSFRHIVLFALISLFLVTRIFLAYWHQAAGSDVLIYGINALEFRESLREGTSVYKIHEKLALENLAKKKSNGVSNPLVQNQGFEYPPLAILWEALPIFFVGGDEQLDNFTQQALAAWKHLFKIFYLIFELLVFLIILWLYFNPAGFLKTDLPGLCLYVVSGFLLGNFLYDRQDLILGGLIFFSFVLLLSRLHWTAAFFMLAAGINFKLVPALLIPIFLIGSLPGQFHNCLYEDFFNRKFLLAILKRIMFLTAMVLGIFAPFYLWGGKSTLDFLLYHSERGLQLESTYSSLLMVLSFLGLPVRVNHEFGAYNLDSALAPFFAGISTLLVAILVLGLFFVLIRAIKHNFSRTGLSNSTVKHEPNLAQTMPQTFICLTIATLLAGISAAKVFSPQYLIWVIPLFALISYRDKRNLTIAIFFVATCLLTALIFPHFYYSDFVHDKIQLPDGSHYWAAPTLTASIILFTRNLLVIATTIMLILAAIADDRSKTAVVSI